MIAGERQKDAEVSRALANGLFAWLQDDDTGPAHPPRNDIAEERLRLAGVMRADMGALRDALRAGEEATRLAVQLYFSGFEKQVLEAIIGDRYDGDIQAYIQDLSAQYPGLFSEAPGETQPPAATRKLGQRATRVLRPRGEVATTDDLAPELDDENNPGTLSGVDLSPDIVRDWLRQIAKTPLLTAVEEVELSKQIEAGLYAQRILDGDEARDIEASDDELRQIAEEGKVAKDHMVQANLRLVVSLAKSWTGRELPFADIISEGHMGLIHAVEKFDYAKGYKFSTYATWWIKQSITRAFTNQARIVRIPVHKEGKIVRMRQVMDELEATLGRKPTTGEIAKQAGITEEEVAENKLLMRSTFSLDEPMGDGKGGDSDTTRGDREAVAPDRSGEVVDNLAYRGFVEQMLGFLDDRTAAMVRMRYMDGHTYEEVGAAFGVTKERARQVLAQGMITLRVIARKQGMNSGDLFSS